MRVGLRSRVAEAVYFGRDALAAVSDRGLLESRLAIPVRALSGLECMGVDWLGLASGISGVRLGRDGVGTGMKEDRGAGFVRRGVIVGSRRYRARLHRIHVQFTQECLKYKQQLTQQLSKRSLSCTIAATSPVLWL